MNLQLEHGGAGIELVLFPFSLVSSLHIGKYCTTKGRKTLNRMRLWRSRVSWWLTHKDSYMEIFVFVWTYNSSIQKAEARGSRIPWQPGLLNKMVSQGRIETEGWHMSWTWRKMRRVERRSYSFLRMENDGKMQELGRSQRTGVGLGMNCWFLEWEQN